MSGEVRAPLDPSRLRVRIVDREKLLPEDRALLAARPVAGRWLAILYEAYETEEQIFERIVERSELDGLGGEEKAFAAAVANDRTTAPAELEVMKVTDECQVFFFHSPDDPNLSGRVFDLAALLETVSLSPELSAVADLSRGAIVGIPMEVLLVVFFVATGDIGQGAFSVVENVLANHDEEDEESVAPEAYWVHEGRFEPIGFVVDEADGLPDDLRLPAPLRS